MQKLFFVLLACFSLVLTSCGGGGGGGSADESAVSIKFSTGGSSSRSARAAFELFDGSTLYVFLKGDFVGYGKSVISGGSATVTIHSVPVGASVTAYAVVTESVDIGGGTLQVGRSEKTTISSGGTTIKITDAERLESSFSISHSTSPAPGGYYNNYTLETPSGFSDMFSYSWVWYYVDDETPHFSNAVCQIHDESGYSLAKCVVTAKFPGGSLTFDIYP